MSHPVSQRPGHGSRRHFLRVTSAFAAGTSALPGFIAGASEAAPAAQSSSSFANGQGKQADPIRIGVLLGTFGEPTLEAKRDAVKVSRLDCGQ